MKIELNEIWNFLDIAPEPKGADRGNVWVYDLVAGDISIQNLTSEHIISLKEEEAYDTELLPSIFTFREILWQPNVYTQPSQCIPQLNILKVFCDEYMEEWRENQEEETTWPYAEMLEGLSKYCTDTLDQINGTKSENTIRIAKILGELRRKAFPLIKFFIFHPKNRNDYQTDALNRLNYAVKIMLTQYNNNYHDLKDPYWKVSVGNQENRQADLSFIKETPAPSEHAPGDLDSSEELKTPPLTGNASET